MNKKPCKHKFKPRYDKQYTTQLTEIIKHGYKADRLDNTACEPYLKERIYVHDICKKCGKVIKRKNNINI